MTKVAMVLPESHAHSPPAMVNAIRKVTHMPAPRTKPTQSMRASRLRMLTPCTGWIAGR